MAEAVVSMVVERLGNLLIEETKIIHGVREQVRDIRDELWWMQCFLKDADARQYEDHRVRTWVREIKEIAYDAGDVLESFILRVESRRGGSILNVLKRYACIVNEGIVRHKVGSKVAAIENRISKLTTRLQTYGIRSLSEDRGSLNSANQRQIQLRRTYSHFVQDDFVGLENEVEKLVEHLVNDDRKVVAICGMGGLGKTTLAKKIYHHEEVKSHFQAHVWVCISQQWQPTTILQQILAKLTPDKENEINKEKDIGRLIKKISDVQREKKCLVILDDIWHEDAWDYLKAAFPMRDMGGKILLTSRNVKVAEHVDPNVKVHRPRPLTHEECLKLLKKKAFTMGNDTDVEEKEDLAKEMIKECKGLPLAVIVLGGILATKHSLNEWKKVHQSIKSYITRGEGMGQHDSGVSKILGLSYNDLPYQLKPCFLYLGKFEEDKEIETKRLYQLWIAESMVLSEDRREGETMMDVAEHYLDELAQRCMVQVQLAEGYVECGKFKSCRLHDLMRDLSLSNGKEENFIHIIDIQHENNPDLVESSSSFSNRTRRVVVYLDDKNTNGGNFSLDKEKSSSLRSLFLFMAKEDYRQRDIPCMLKSHLNDFKMLRVLAIESVILTSPDWNIIKWAKLIHDHLALSNAIGKLIHLRYLSLRISGLLIIPSSIKNLKHLQTLYLQGKFHLYLPCSATLLQKMRRLQHLYLPRNCGHKVFKPSKLQLDGLSNLETLENFDSSWCDSKGLCKLINLRKLRAYSKQLEEVERIIEYLSSTAAKHMRYSYFRISGQLNFNSEEGHTVLTKILRCGRLTELVILSGTCKKLPRYDEVLNFSQSLTVLKLGFLSHEEDPMPTLEKLPNLQVLTLLRAFNGKIMVCSENGFPQLKSLRLNSIEFLENWRVEEGAMPKLSELHLSKCKNLKAVPDGLRFVTTLKELVIGGMDEEFKRRVKVVDGEEGEDFDKIRHVTSVIYD